MAIIEDDLARAVTEGFRLAQLDIANQDKLLTGPDDVQIELANGQKKKGPSWPKIAKLAEDANLPAFTTIANNVHTDAQQVAGDKTTAGASKDAAKISETNAKTSENNAASSKSAAKTSETNSKTSETNAASSAAQAKIDADRAQLANPDNWESAPYPDVWIPFNDSLKMEAGFGPYDTIKVGTDTINLPSRSATFTRASTATYIDKSGVLQTAAINEPRFEKEGLLIEGQSTNTAVYSDTFENSAIGKVNCNASAGGIITGTSTGGASTGQTRLEFYNTTVTDRIGTISVEFDKSKELKVTEVRLADIGNGTGLLTSYIDGSYTDSVNGLKWSIKNLPDDWVRIVLSINAPLNGTTTARVNFGINGSNVAENTAGKTGALRRVQIEAQTFATSYIPTNGAAATRVPDNCSIPLKNNIPLFPSAMSLSMEVNQPQDTKTEYRTLMEYAGTTLMIYANTNRLRREGTVDQNNNINISTAAFNTPGKTLFAVSQGASSDGEILTVVNGTLGRYTGWLFSNPAAAAPMFSIGRSGIRNIWGHVRNFRIWHRALTDAQLKSLR